MKKFKKNSMKTILFLVLLFPTLMFGQVSTWRTNPPQQSTPQPRVETPKTQQSAPQRNDVSNWRNNPPQQQLQPNPDPRGRIRVQNWNRQNQFGYYWGNWGWYQPLPYIWYDDLGWRQRSVIHIYESGKRDTIRKESPYTTFGFGHTNNKQVSYWGAVGGKKGYFILDYVMTYEIDQNKYYPYGNIAIADFPISDNDFKKESAIYLGAGKRINKLGIHGMIGFGREILRYQGRDAIGGISFPKSNTNFTTFKIGVIRDFNFLTIKFDVDPIRKYTQIAIGLNNK
jgi:hypothetical protein